MKSLLLPLVLVAACGTPLLPTPPLVQVNNTIVIPPSLLQECRNLDQLDERPYTEEDILKAISNWSMENTECKDKHKALVDVVQKAFNSK